MNWSDKGISWGREDHPSIMPNPGTYPLVVDALVSSQKFSCLFSRVLVDGGSTINILYRETMMKLGLTERDLQSVGQHSTGLCPAYHAPPWVAFSWMSSLAPKRISEE